MHLFFRRIFKYLSIYFLIAFYTQASATILDTKISIDEDNVSLIELLNRIELKADITFSFKSNTINRDEIVSLHVQNTAIANVLDQIIDTSTVGYYALGTQIILFTKSPSIEKADTPKNENNTFKKIPVTDTVRILVFDTITIHDTAIVEIYDTATINVYDTIVYKKPLPPAENFQQHKGLNMSVDFLYAHNIPQKESYTLSVWEGGLQMSKEALRNIFIETGMGIKRLQCKYGTEQFSISQKIDSMEIEQYHYFNKTIWLATPYQDTAYYTVVDSTLSKTFEYTTNIDTVKEKDNELYYYMRIPLYISCQKSLSKKFTLDFATGITTNILINAKNSNSEKIKVSPVHISIDVKASAKYLLYKQWNIAGSIQYSHYPHYYLYTRNIGKGNLVGFSAGVGYSF